MSSNLTKPTRLSRTYLFILDNDIPDSLSMKDPEGRYFQHRMPIVLFGIDNWSKAQ